ncbi:Putative uncharacterized protein [Moritella viscosa]|uniref:Uncharacterized protein n=1 Tax=Moritella viscosa TaxID=80854 RepID=A0A1L0AVB3_9GAMM|nr:Putative uncharacterized protein [Moritella viscosa]SGY92682.1 Putative uncharacterized protein [Moritella viscosa]SGY96533.1 Putative uncharacterized protein [Moritella viscosa]SHO04300.1 Putative uncharacterized protein [Moritella viscosa]SHO04301.1 Putative uncharacterized protein [Moritella viscosa]
MLIIVMTANIIAKNITIIANIATTSPINLAILNPVKDNATAD